MGKPGTAVPGESGKARESRRDGLGFSRKHGGLEAFSAESP